MMQAAGDESPAADRASNERSAIVDRQIARTFRMQRREVAGDGP